MDTLKSSLLIIGQVFGLVLGSNFTSPTDQTLERYSHLQFHF